MFDEVVKCGDIYCNVVMKIFKLVFFFLMVLEFFISVVIVSFVIYIGFLFYGVINWGFV